MACNAPRNFIGCAVWAASRRPAILATFCADLAVSSSRHSVCDSDLTRFGPLEERLHHRADVTDERSRDGLVAVHLRGCDVDLDELGVGVPLRRIAMSEQPVQAGTDEHHHVGPLQGQRPGGGRRLRVVVGQQALRHRHRQVRHAGGFDEFEDLLVRLRVCGALAEHDQGPLGVGEQVDRGVDRLELGQLARRRVDDPPQRPSGLLRIDHLAQHRGRDVEVDPSGAAGHRGADRARHAAADVLGPRYPVSSLGEHPGRRQLIHLFVVASLKVHEMALAGSGDLDHREAVRGGIGKRHKPVEEARGGHRQADARLLRQEPGRRRRMAGVALVAEADVADARRLCEPSQVGDRDPDDSVDGVHVVELECVDDQVDPIGEGARIVGALLLRVSHGSDGHDVDPSLLFEAN